MTGQVSEFEIVAFPRSRVIGVHVRVTPGANPVPATWERVHKSADLAALPNRLFPQAFVGWMGDYNPSDRSFSYVAGILCSAEQQPCDGMRAVDIPACTLAISTIPAGPRGGHQASAQAYTEAGYRADGSLPFEMEWFEGTKERGVFRYCSPVTKA